MSTHTIPATTPATTPSATTETTHTTTMRAVTQDRYGSAAELRVTERPRTVPLSTEVLVRVHAAGVNPVDWKTREGHGAPEAPWDPSWVLGWDVAGVVEAVGYGVTTHAVGDRVFGMPWFPRPAGAYAEYVTAPSRQLARTPDALTDVEAAAVPLAALTAWQALVDTAAVRTGDRVLVTAGAGGVGHLAVQIARHLGAHVVATASPQNHAWLRELGAAEVLDYHQPGYLTGVADVDVVVGLAGHDTEGLLATLRRGGILVGVGVGITPEVAALAAASGVRAVPMLVEPDGAALAQIAQLLDAGTVRPEVAKVFPLAEVAAAHELGETGRTRGKIVLDLDA